MTAGVWGMAISRQFDVPRKSLAAGCRQLISNETSIHYGVVLPHMYNRFVASGDTFRGTFQLIFLSIRKYR
jgi:hypothetical protein